MKTLKKWSAESVEFGESVRRRRKALGLSQEDLAAKSGMHPTYLSGIENGARNPTLKTICALASALEVRAAILFTNKTDRAKQEGG